jgi:hypothetical protein
MNIQQRLDDLNTKVLELEKMQYDVRVGEEEKEGNLNLIVNDLGTLLNQFDPSNTGGELIGIQFLMNRVSKLSEEIGPAAKIKKLMQQIKV